jgi:hypothetical protein
MTPHRREEGRPRHWAAFVLRKGVEGSARNATDAGGRSGFAVSHCPFASAAPITAPMNTRSTLAHIGAKGDE